jgi:hypothetical protein
MILKIYYNRIIGKCQYTKSCIFGWKIKLKICTTKVLLYRFMLKNYTTKVGIILEDWGNGNMG